MQLHAVNEPFFPNLTTLDLWNIWQPLIPFIPLLLSPSITSICLGSFASHLPGPVVASLIANLPTPCPNLQDITLRHLPRDPMITAAVSKMVFSINQSTLREFHINSSLTKEASEVVYKLQNLRGLSVVIKKGASISSALLPNLIRLQIEFEDGSDGLQFCREVKFGKLESVDFYIQSGRTGDFLEAFTGAALSPSVQNTLSAIRLLTDWSWRLLSPSIYTAGTPEN